jgi:hypothetical protein
MSANELNGGRPRLALAVIAVAAAAVAHANADEPSPSRVPPGAVQAPGWPDTDTVKELLRRETRAALAAQERRHGSSSPSSRADPPSQAQPPADRIDLNAIYGVGNKLHAEVLMNGRRLHYRHGRKWPDEAPDGDGVYALRAVEGHCVRLDDAGSGRRICLAFDD